MTTTSFQDNANGAGMGIYGSNSRPTPGGAQASPINALGTLLLSANGTIDISNYKYVSMAFFSEKAAYVHTTYEY